MIIKALLVFLLFAVPGYAQTGSRAVLYAGTAFDLASMEFALKRGYAEGNSILGQNRYRRIGIASGAAVATDLLGQWAASRWPESRKAVRVLNWVAGSAHFSFGMYNMAGDDLTRWPYTAVGYRNRSR